ncbi:hypothetical protein ACODUL_02605 [Stenotrophomonas maltophilia]
MTLLISQINGSQDASAPPLRWTSITSTAVFASAITSRIAAHRNRRGMRRQRPGEAEDIGFPYHARRAMKWRL